MPAINATGPYLPRADGELRDWLNNFARIIARAPWAMALTPADAERLVDLAQRYETAYLRATSPETRCSPAVAVYGVERFGAALARAA